MSDSDEEASTHDWLNLSSESVDAAVMRRGEKDYEPDGTNTQQIAIQRSRDAMYTALIHPRIQGVKHLVEGEWDSQKQMARVNIVRGTHFRTMGFTNREGTWLRPEEVTYLVQRGSMLCYLHGKPLSVQATCSLALSVVGLDKMSVYAHLKKLGYVVRRQHDLLAHYDDSYTSKSWLWLPWKSCLLWRWAYFNYSNVYRDLRVISDLQERPQPEAVDFCVWKPSATFKKSQPGPPDYFVKVLSARKNIPDLQMQLSLLSGVPICQNKNLREGKRAPLVLAIVDSAVVSFVRIGEPVFESNFY